MAQRARSLGSAALAGLWPLFSALSSAAQPMSGSLGSRTQALSDGAPPSVLARSETYLQLFRRALLPGANGALVESETALPIHQYVLVDARGVRSPFEQGTLDFELSAFGRLWLTDMSAPWNGPGAQEPRFDGDVQTANVRYQTGPFSLRLGRQHVAGGAARFVRFDGASAGVNHSSGLFGEAYAGFAVLPRWNAQPGYHHLGSLEGELRVDTEDLPRRRHWLFGARAGYATQRFQGSLSFHEAHARSLAQRNLGLDLATEPTAWLSAGGSALMELDSRRLARARLFIDARPSPILDLGAELFHAEPALLLSRQSVLSVFTTDGYEELGGTLGLRPWTFLRVEASAYAGVYSEGELGGRSELAARVQVDRATYVRLSHARVQAPENGYHALRASLRRELFARCTSTLEAYGYFYDEPIRGRSTSAVYAGTLAYQPLSALELLLGGSLAASPYAALDAQALFRARYEFGALEPRRFR